MPVVPATWEAEAGRFFEPGSLRLQSAIMKPLCSRTWVTEQGPVLQERKKCNKGRREEGRKGGKKGREEGRDGEREGKERE